MQEGPIYLRQHRAAVARRHGAWWRLPLLGGVVAVVIGAACWGPIAPSVFGPGAALAPLSTVPQSETADLPLDGGLSVAGASARPTAVTSGHTPPGEAPGIGSPRPTPLPIAPTPVALSIGPAGQALMAGVVSDRSAQWVKNHAETALRSGPEDASSLFTTLPQWSVLKVVESRPNWLLVQYSGDGQTRQPGPGWVRASDVGAIDAPAVWLSASRPTTLWSRPDVTGSRVEDVPAATIMEVGGLPLSAPTRVHVRLPGDGRGVAPAEGWMDADALARARTPSVFEVPVAYPEALSASVRMKVPYRTQLDGSDFAGANCGPTVLGMALEAFGTNVHPADLRGQVLTDESFEVTDTDAGSYIWALADVARQNGLSVNGLYDADGASLRRWTVEDVRAAVQSHQPVILQVYYRALPGRSDSGYYGDHYIIVTGLVGDDFLYNDPIGGAVARETPGFDRLISPAGLQRAMHASDTPYAYSAFSLSRS